MQWLPTPWRVFGPMGPAILLVWAMLSFATLEGDAQLALKGKSGNAYHLIGRDFVNIWFGGKQANEGKLNRIYDREAYREDLKTETGIIGIYAFSYPPHMLMASIPFGRLPYFIALFVWTTLTLGLFWHAARPWLAEVGLPGWSVLVLPASMVNLWAGHFGFLIGALALYGWRQAATHPTRSGLAFAAMTVKPHLGLLIPVLLVLRRQWRTIGWAAILTLAIVSTSTLPFGLAPWQTWFQSTLTFQSSLIGTIEPGMGFLMMMPTVERFAASLGFGTTGSLIIQLGFGGVTMALLISAFRRGSSLSDLGLLSLIAIFLILPYAFNYDMVACNMAVLLLMARMSDRLNLSEKIVLGTTLLVPLLQMPLASAGIQLAAPLLLASLAILVRRL